MRMGGCWRGCVVVVGMMRVGAKSGLCLISSVVENESGKDRMKGGLWAEEV
jgi:hypothetical protein